MFTLSSRSKLATVIAGLTLVAAGHVGAADKKIEGIVESVDYETNSVTVIDNAGEAFTYAFTGTPKVDVNGRKLRDMTAVEPGQHVTLKVKTIKKEKPVNLVKGEILEINREQNLALIRPVDGGAPRVIELPETVAVSGLHSGASVEDLQEGHFVTLKYTAR
ncbi:hypothetical protein [Gilvimarinus algae]|uniref:DUF5666 domain-containing protein n=1 Tax=Gilvimarinus algae TaxID=3058037 RepID=A0ABT8TJ13_9GAMM|nr:hypothetical protein [Gilvimarinus sp. SDUM040014]MDO3384045.1 hypothetical protein [Gilvimarinus sp. SDUM040014]